jgi:DNA-directed RNA polymerase subunit RPC12/RpoP
MSDSPYELQRLVVVATFSTPWEAQIAQTRLSAEGLHSLIADEHLIRLVALSNAIGGIHLKVRERDAGAAAEVLRRLVPLPEIYLVTQDAPGEAGEAGPEAGPIGLAAPAEPRMPAQPPEPAEAAAPDLRCPACGSGELLLEHSSRLVLGVLPVSRRGYRCSDCGVLWKTDEIERWQRPGPREPETPADAPPAPQGRLAPEDGWDAAETTLTTAARFHTPWEAHLARTLLESEGVRCCVLEERMLAVRMLSAEPAAFNRLEVRQADAARAAEILARAFSYPSLVAVPDPDPDPGADADAEPSGEPGADPARGPGPDS